MVCILTDAEAHVEHRKQVSFVAQSICAGCERLRRLWIAVVVRVIRRILIGARVESVGEDSWEDLVLGQIEDPRLVSASARWIVDVRCHGAVPGQDGQL